MTSQQLPNFNQHNRRNLFGIVLKTFWTCGSEATFLRWSHSMRISYKLEIATNFSTTESRLSQFSVGIFLVETSSKIVRTNWTYLFAAILCSWFAQLSFSAFLSYTKKCTFPLFSILGLLYFVAFLVYILSPFLASFPRRRSSLALLHGIVQHYFVSFLYTGLNTLRAT